MIRRFKKRIARFIQKSTDAIIVRVFAVMISATLALTVFFALMR